MTERPGYAQYDPYDGFGGEWGYQTDKETGLVLCGARYYDPSTGRWLTRDPIGYAGGVDLYRYCGNNPINGVDPSGLDHGIITIGPGGRGWGKVYADPGDNLGGGKQGPCQGGELVYGPFPISNHPSKGHKPFDDGTFCPNKVGHGRKMGPNFLMDTNDPPYSDRGTWIHSGRGDDWDHPTNGCIRGTEDDINKLCDLFRLNPNNFRIDVMHTN